MPEPTAPSQARGFLQPSPPESGFESGRNLLAECPEFKLYELRHTGGRRIVERSKAVEKAYWKSTFRISDSDEQSATTEDERIEWASAILDLAEFSKSHSVESLRGIKGAPTPREGAVNAASALALTIGQKLKPLQDIEDRDEVLTALEDCVAQFKNAVRAYAASTWALPDKRSMWRISREAAIITHAEMLFFHTLKRPTKSEVRGELEGMGMTLKGKNAKINWSEAFMKAALGELPE